MLKVTDKVVFNLAFCQQCGTCFSICPVNAISLKMKENGLNMIYIDQGKCDLCKKCVKNCPANINTEIEDYFDLLDRKDYYLGSSRNNKVRKNASSGGVARTLIVEGLKNGLIDGIYALKKTTKYPYCEGFFFNKAEIPEYEDIPNSIYHSVMLNSNLNKITQCGRLMVVGTNCQMKNIDQILKGKYDEIIKVCIFCKQQKTFESTKFLGKIMGEKLSISNTFTLNYRGDGWPGHIRLNKKQLPYNVAAIMPFGKRLWSVPGCNICANPFGENADVTLMDPWCIDKQNTLGQTLIIVHNNKGLALINQMKSFLHLKLKTFSEVQPALGIADIKAKNLLIPFYKGQKQIGLNHRLIGSLDKLQRDMLGFLLLLLPRLPILIYKILNRLIPNPRKFLSK